MPVEWRPGIRVISAWLSREFHREPLRRPGTGIDDSYWVIPSPDGSRILVAGVSLARQSHDVVVVAYDRGNGEAPWAVR